jgi:hypothetical protein
MQAALPIYLAIVAALFTAWAAKRLYSWVYGKILDRKPSRYDALGRVRAQLIERDLEYAASLPKTAPLGAEQARREPPCQH